MNLDFGKMGGAGKKNIRRAAAAVCEMLEQRQMLDADSYTFFSQATYSAVEDSTLQVGIHSAELTYQHSLTAYYSITSGSAHEGEDYIGTTGSVTLTGNESYSATRTFDIPILKDNLVEGDETFTVTLTSVSEGHLGTQYPPGLRTQTTVTIIDHPPVVSASLSGNGLEYDPATGQPRPISIALTRSGGDMSAPLGISLLLRPESTADSQDLTLPEVSFAPQESYKVVQIPVVDDTQPEWLETALIEVRPAGSPQPGSCVSATITDDDAGLVYQNLPEETEPTPNENNPGGLLSMNWDDDNSNGTADYLDGQQGSGAPADDELQPVNVNLPASYLGDVARVSFSAGQNTNLRLWLDMAKTQPVSTSPYDWDVKPSVIYVEGIASGTRGITMTAHYGSYDYPGHILWETPAIGDAVTITALAAPSGFYGTLGNAKNVVKLNWTDPHIGETGFKLQWRVSGDNSWTDLGTVGEVETTPHTLPADYPGKTYEYRIFSIATAAGVSVTSGPATTTGSGIALQSVEFTGAQTVLRDRDGTAYSGAQWYDANMNGEIDAEANISTYSNDTFDGIVEQRYPVSYVRTSGLPGALQNKYLHTTVTMPYYGSQLSNLSVIGEAPGYTFVADSISGGNHNAVTATLNAQEALPQAIRDTEVEITWKLSTDGGISYMTIGDSITRVYVTGGAASPAYETVLDIGCSAADGVNMRDGEHNQSDQNTALDHIWSKFSGRNVYRVDHTLAPLKYYGSYNTQYTTTANLLQYGDGQCGAWVNLLWSTLVAQGVTGDPTHQHPNQIVKLEPKSQSTYGANGFIVANWSFDGDGNSDDPYFPYVNTYTGALPFNSTGYTWLSADVTDDAGVPGQSTANPKSNFTLHYMLKIWDGSEYTYYDPSYGKTYESLDEFDATIAGYYYVATFQGHSAYFFWKNTSPTGDHLLETSVFSA